MLIEAKNITKEFPLGQGLFQATDRVVHAVDSVDLSIERGRTLALVGESGSGKTTLGRIICRLLEPTTGTVTFNGLNITAANNKSRRQIRQDLQFIFQDPYSSLNPRHNIRRIIARPFEVHTNLTKAEIDRKIIELLDSVGLTPPEPLMHRFPHQFSGGQRQRIVFARAIALHPEFIVADEPVSSLDMSVKAQLLTLLRQFQVELHLTYLFITHELSVVRTIAKDVAVMYLGRIVETAPVNDLFEGPLHPYSEALLDATPSLDPKYRRSRKIFLEGVMPSPIDPPVGCHFHTRCPYAERKCREKVPPLRQIQLRGVACHFVGQPKFPLSANLSALLIPEAERGAEIYSGTPITSSTER